MTKYYSVRYYPNSDTKACFGKIISQSKADFEKQLAEMTKGCEDWQVVEISRDVFLSLSD